MQVSTAKSQLARHTNEVKYTKAVKKSGLSESTIARITKASRTGYNPKLSTLVKLSNATKTPISILIGQLS